MPRSLTRRQVFAVRYLLHTPVRSANCYLLLQPRTSTCIAYRLDWYDEFIWVVGVPFLASLGKNLRKGQIETLLIGPKFTRSDDFAVDHHLPTALKKKLEQRSVVLN